jgi:hypothetical protein
MNKKFLFAGDNGIGRFASFPGLEDNPQNQQRKRRRRRKSSKRSTSTNMRTIRPPSID